MSFPRLKGENFRANSFVREFLMKFLVVAWCFDIMTFWHSDILHQSNFQWNSTRYLQKIFQLKSFEANSHQLPLAHAHDASFSTLAVHQIDNSSCSSPRRTKTTRILFMKFPWKICCCGNKAEACLPSQILHHINWHMIIINFYCFSPLGSFQFCLRTELSNMRIEKHEAKHSL